MSDEVAANHAEVLSGSSSRSGMSLVKKSVFGEALSEVVSVAEMLRELIVCQSSVSVWWCRLKCTEVNLTKPVPLVRFFVGQSASLCQRLPQVPQPDDPLLVPLSAA